MNMPQSPYAPPPSYYSPPSPHPSPLSSPASPLHPVAPYRAGASHPAAYPAYPHGAGASPPATSYPAAAYPAGPSAPVLPYSAAPVPGVAPAVPVATSYGAGGSAPMASSFGSSSGPGPTPVHYVSPRGPHGWAGQPSGAWPGTGAGAHGWAPTGGASATGWSGAVGPVVVTPSSPRRRSSALVAGLIGALLLPVALIGAGVATLVNVHQQTTEQATRTLTDCSARGSDQACGEALGPVEPEAIAATRAAVAAMERGQGEFRSLDAHGVCSLTTNGTSFRELRAHVQWSSGREAMVFRWQEVGERWRLDTIAPQGRLPPLCD